MSRKEYLEQLGFATSASMEEGVMHMPDYSIYVGYYHPIDTTFSYKINDVKRHHSIMKLGDDYTGIDIGIKNMVGYVEYILNPEKKLAEKFGN